MKSTRIPAFTGINNRAPLDRLPTTEGGAKAVRDAVNVDLTQAGSFQRRPGFDRVIESPACRSLFQDGAHLYYASESELMRYDGTTSEVVSPIASVLANVCYQPTPTGLIWSDSFSIKRTKRNQTQPLSVPEPNPMPSVSAIAGGALVGGMYAVCFAATASDGRRSAMTEPVFVDVPESGRIRLQMPALTRAIEVFVSAPDGSVFYRDRTLPIGTMQQDITIAAFSGEPVVYETMAPLPAGRMLALHNGRLMSASGPVAAYSKPYHYDLYRPNRDYFMLDSAITLLASVEGGVYVATAHETFFLPGPDVATASLNKIANHGAVFGTLTDIPNSTDLMWFSGRGPVRASQSGELSLPQDASIAFNPAIAGASIWRESNGLRTFVTALQEKDSTGAALFGSYMDADVIKN